jgi:hypothetical protein
MIERLGVVSEEGRRKHQSNNSYTRQRKNEVKREEKNLKNK